MSEVVSWPELHGGYRRPYDSRPALTRLEMGDLSAWGELWEQLHHQGDVGEASYAAVPELVRIQGLQDKADWNTYALAATIEEARLSGRNPALPLWLAENYRDAWRTLANLALAALPAAEEDSLVSSLLAVLALEKGKVTLARLAMLTEDEREEMLDEAGWG